MVACALAALAGCDSAGRRDEDAAPAAAERSSAANEDRGSPIRVARADTTVAGDHLADASGADAAPGARLGAWSGPFAWPVNPVHMHVLPDETVLTWGINTEKNFPGWTDAALWNPARDEMAGFRENTTNFFCAGHTLLPDGRLLVAGGHVDIKTGTRDVNLFDPRDRSWTMAGRMNAGRWYPSVTLLENGDALIIGGTIRKEQTNTLPQVWTGPGRLRDLTGAVRPLPNYPWAFLAPNGKVFLAGPNRQSRYLTTDGVGSITDFAPRVVEGVREYGSAVMYDEGRVLVIGGGDPPTATAEVIDLTDPEPRWRLTGSMSAPRRQFNATLLADGTVLVTGGTKSPGHSDPAGAILDAEIWDPRTGRWTVVARMPKDRLYHSTAALLPDGRVLTGGGWAHQVEIYSPPYLFAPDGSPAVRPRLTGAPDSVAYGAPFFAASPDADEIEKAHLIRLSSATHALNLQQRLSRLPFERALGPGSVTGLRVQAPSGPRLAPPGHYLLFLLNREGVPSTGRIVWIG